MTKMRRFKMGTTFGLVGLLATILLSQETLAADHQISPAHPLEVSPKLSNEKEAENISGAACAVRDQKHASCLLIGDEVKFARFFTMNDDTLVPGNKLFLLPETYKDGKEIKEYDETDAEGIAYSKPKDPNDKNSRGFYYLVGSHGLNKSGELQPSRYFIYRFSVEQATGQAADLGSKDSPSTQVERSANLQKIIHGDPQLLEHEEDIPDKGGINIEGLAVAGDDLYIGFRGPLLDGQAVIASLPVGDAFDNPKAKLKKYSVFLGEGQGVRDIAAVDGGFLVLSGPQRDTSGPSSLCFWKPGSDPDHCFDVVKAGPDDSKPEALAVVDTTPDHYEVLIMSDGPRNGAPAIYEIPRK
ncbi:DUF3616 domain-containing protein [Rhizobium leguminosarum bv. viciae]|nr:DUF3616 domain-containing protein [Rhizobium leguminosarum bv. viciae]